LRYSFLLLTGLVATIAEAQTIPVTPTSKARPTQAGVAISAARAATAAAPRQVGPPLPYREERDCEYCDRLMLACSAVKARVADRIDTAVAFAVAPGDTLALLHGRTHVFTPGKIFVRDTLRPALMPFGAPRAVRALTMLPGDTIYVLTVGAEGSEGTWWYRGQQYRSENNWMADVNQPYMLPGRSRLVTRAVSSIKSAWWLQVRNVNGQVGWIQHHPRTVAIGSHYGARPDCK
jgi:hypothetical protein